MRLYLSLVGLFNGFSAFAGGSILILICCVSSNAQVSQTKRYEREQKNSEDYFNVISLKSDGLALFRERDKYKNSNKIWELVLLDTALQEKSVIELEVNEKINAVIIKSSALFAQGDQRTGGQGTC